jgi:hypothetical protein
VTRPNPDPAVRYAAQLADMPRRFALYRVTDVSGVSGTGIIAWGIAYGAAGDEDVAIRWRGDTTGVQQLCIFRSVQQVLLVHGHAGKTRIVWLDEPATVEPEAGS